MAPVVLITGGTGSFGQEMVAMLLRNTDWTIRVFSRDEQKQDRMKRELQDVRTRYLLGDVRDPERVRRAMKGVDHVIHAAALKIIPAGEYNPDEVIKTNILGSHNVIEAAIDAGVKSVVCLSSDKAVSPVNLYGNTKACMEKLAILANQYSGETVIKVVRYGNVIGSRGSILTLLKEQAAAGSIRMTHADMTRFWITLPEACRFVMQTLSIGPGPGIYIPWMKSCLVLDLCVALYPDVSIEFVGMRNGEKMHEWLSNEYEILENTGWCWKVKSDSWACGQTPISSNSTDCLTDARDLLSEGGFSEEAKRAAG